MQLSDIKPGAKLRNRNMLDLDFAVLRQGTLIVEGMWVLRRNRWFMGADTIRKDRIKLQDWTVIKEGS